MSGENTENPQDPIADAANEVPVPSPTPGAELPIAADIVDPDAVVPDFEVPPPPTFDSMPPVPEPVLPEEQSVPDAAPEPAFPPPPPAPGVPEVESSAAKHAFSPPSEPGYTGAVPAPYADLVSYPEPGTSAPNSYRGWTIGIFVGLAVLLIAAIVGLFLLFSRAPLTFPDLLAPAPVVTSDSAPQRDEPASSVPLTSDSCGVLCAEVSAVLGDAVTGADGDVRWRLSDSWKTTAPDALAATEIAAAEYTSDVGTLSLTVWAFDDDAATDDAFATLSSAQGDPDDSGSVYESGAGIRNEYSEGNSKSILWSVTGEETQPWVMLIEGPDDDAVFQFYLALPI